MAINALLTEERIRAHDLSVVGITFCNVKIIRFLQTLKEEFLYYYKIRDIAFFTLSHHKAHAYAAWGTSDFQESLVLTSDGAGDIIDGMFEAESLFNVKKGKINLLERRLQSAYPDMEHQPQLFNYALMDETIKANPISLGQKYEQFTHLIGFGSFGDGKTMGLASYGTPLFDLHDYLFNGFDFSLTYGSLLDRVNQLKEKSGMGYQEFIYTYRHDLAATAQAFIERALKGILLWISKRYKNRSICLGGGVFLNCVANHKAIRSAFPFEKVHILPAAGDDGQSIGAAIYAYHTLFDTFIPTSKVLPYLGPKQDKKSIVAALKNFKLKYNYLSDKALSRRMVKLLISGKVIGLFRGRSELGPRALGHRSILADPRRKDMKDRLNKEIKFRESFRPYAPMVTAEDQMKIFKLKGESPYMLLAAKVRSSYRKKLPAITHIDNSARIQAVYPKTEPFLHSLIKAFGKKSGVPVLLNTSFNLAGDPIVESPHEAISTFLNCGMDVLVLGNCIIERKE
ncbi:MAG: hypothetical protein HQM14_20015 [SAR324 cluster bacterium]|nr:hypothetical protein [SAR324 cluster bacterium]